MTLYLVATPIGNLSDLSLRAIETLKKVDMILCEDTRTSLPLLRHYEIQKPLKSFHMFSEKKEEEGVIRALKEGQEIALISDAGTPGINDPGERLIKRCHQEGIPCTAIPGACSPIVALTLSGLPMEKFQYIGFLPKKGGERKKALLDALFYEGVTLFFESPQRIHQTLEEIAEWGPTHQLAIVREITKKYEEVLRGVASDLLKAEIRGEIVVVLEGNATSGQDPEELVPELMERFDLPKPEAIKLAANLLGLPKKEVYSKLEIH